MKEFEELQEFKERMGVWAKRALVPQGLNDRSLAIHCQENVPLEGRPVGYGVSFRAVIGFSPTATRRPSQPDHTVPYGTGPVSRASLAMNRQATFVQVTTGQGASRLESHTAPLEAPSRAVV
jgi:hypothetical protein